MGLFSACHEPAVSAALGGSAAEDVGEDAPGMELLLSTAAINNAVAERSSNASHHSRRCPAPDGE